MQALDIESVHSLEEISRQEWALRNRLPGARTVLVVLSSAGMVYDTDALQYEIVRSYPDAAVFFASTMGKPLGSAPPEHVDLLIDLTGPGQRQPFLFARKLRRMARFAVGRKAGFFRKRIYDRLFDESTAAASFANPLDRERHVQSQVLGLAGVVLAHSGDTPPDRGRITPRELTPLKTGRL